MHAVNYGQSCGAAWHAAGQDQCAQAVTQALAAPLCPPSCSWLPPHTSMQKQLYRRAGSGRRASSAWRASRCALSGAAVCLLRNEESSACSCNSLTLACCHRHSTLQAASTGAAIDDLYKLPAAPQQPATQPQQPQPQPGPSAPKQLDEPGAPASNQDMQGGSSSGAHEAAEAPTPVPATAGEAAAVAGAAAVETSARFGSAALAWLRQRLRWVKFHMEL